MIDRRMEGNDGWLGFTQFIMLVCDFISGSRHQLDSILSPVITLDIHDDIKQAINPWIRPDAQVVDQLSIQGRLVLHLFPPDPVKDRQQEAERHSRYLSLLSRYNYHNIISYMK